MEDERLEGTAEGVEEKALRIVNADFKRASQYLRGWHDECLQRYRHYRAPGLEGNIETANSFPVPFTTEQIDQFTADIMSRIWRNNEPCTIYGRNDESEDEQVVTDKQDADCKKDFFEWQDNADDIYIKMKQAIVNTALYGAAPTVINYKEEFTRELVSKEVPIEIAPGMPLITDGQMVTETVQEYQSKPTYQGATVDLIDPIDFFFTPEKREPYDEYPMMIRKKVSLNWLGEQPFVIPGAVDKVKSEIAEQGGTSAAVADLLGDRREFLGYSKEVPGGPDRHEYVEWQGYANLDGERKLWILGVVDGKVLARMDNHDEVFNLGKPNIIVGLIDKEQGEVVGPSLMDKIHSIQHMMNGLMGMWLKALRQTVNPMWKGNSDLLKRKKIVNEAGVFIDVKGDDPDKAIQRMEQEQISKDIYAGMEMGRTMGQNASGVKDIAGGIVQEGVETLGEASILAGGAQVRVTGGYLNTFEHTWIEPVWSMRNQINMNFCTDLGYLYSILQDKVLNWRRISPTQIRANVDFVCEASNRENERAVVSQQILQLVNLAIGLLPVLGPIPIVQLCRKLCEEGFGWKGDSVNEIFPMAEIIQLYVQNQMKQEEQQRQQQQAKGQSPGSMSQPKTEGQARESAQGQFATPVGRVG